MIKTRERKRDSGSFEGGWEQQREAVGGREAWRLPSKLPSSPVDPCLGRGFRLGCERAHGEERVTGGSASRTPGKRMSRGRDNAGGRGPGLGRPRCQQPRKTAPPHVFWLLGCLGVQRNKFVVWTNSRLVIHHPQ